MTSVGFCSKRKSKRKAIMNFSKEWESAYIRNAQMSIWPWSDVVTYVMRYIKPTGKKFSVLDLGCGSGANIPFFLALGVDYYGIDGSETIIRNVGKRYPKIADRLVCGDFTQNLPFSNKFDLIVDRSSLTLNTSAAIKSCLDKLIYKALKPGGKFLGVDWFSTLHSDFPEGKPIINDLYAKKGYQDGQFGKLGIIHFTNEEHLKKLFSKFNIIFLEQKFYQREIPDDNYVFAAWNFVASKK